MFERPQQFRSTSVPIEERITLLPGETEKARYADWLPEKIADPRNCSRHPGTRLVLDSRRICKITKYGHRAWSEDEEIEPGVFDFTASLGCPACRCADARCPPEFHETSFDTFDTSTEDRKTSLARSREFAEQVSQHRCGFALFIGLPGTGKTRLACNILRALDARDALYVRQGELTSALRATYGRKDVVLHRHQRGDDEEDDGPPTPLEIVQEVRFLVLDEIGCTAQANDERLLLDELLKHRYEQRKPTILITNLPVDALLELVGDALYDRIREASGGGKFILQFQGQSFRRSTGESYLAGLH